MRFIHCADLHLDTPFDMLSTEESSEIRRIQFEAFASLLELVREEKIPLVLIAGDLFDSAYVTRSTVRVVRDGFASCPDTVFVIAPGNHDPYVPGGMWDAAAFTPNVRIFMSSEPESLDLGFALVFGWGFTSAQLERCPIDASAAAAVAAAADDFRASGTDGEERPVFLCAHAHTGAADSRYCPLPPSVLDRCGFDYAALGHIHNPAPLTKIGRTLYGYSGCLVGRDFGETGLKGCYLCEFTPGKEIAHRRMVLTPLRFEYAEADISDCADESAIEDRIRDTIKQLNCDSRTSLRIALTGEALPGIEVNEPLLEMTCRGGLRLLDITDESVPSFDSSKLAADPTIRGAFCRRLLPLINSPDPEASETARRALRLGLAALRE